jgi:hypothetical protein
VLLVRRTYCCTNQRGVEIVEQLRKLEFAKK